MKREWRVNVQTLMVALMLVAAVAASANDMLDADVADMLVFDGPSGDWSAPKGNHKLVEHECGDHFEYPALTAWDACDGEITDSIIIGGDIILPDVVGEYVATYNVQDSGGNAADEATRTIQVIDTLPPVITIFGDNPAFVARDEAYSDGGATAFDACDGDLTGAMTVYSTVDISVAGEYVVAYYVEDAFGNAEEATRVVHVLAAAPEVGMLPDIALSEGMNYKWVGRVADKTDANSYQWYHFDGRNYVPIVDGSLGNGAYDGANTHTLRFTPFTTAMAGNYMLEVSDDKSAVQVTAKVLLQTDSELPATGALGLALTAVAAAFAGAFAVRKRRG